MNKNAIYIAIVGIVIVALLFFVGAREAEEESNNSTPTPAPNNANGDDLNIIDDNWDQYISNEVGFSIEHPEIMEVNEPPIGGVNFTYLGPTQTEDTEIFDGISFTITRQVLPDRFDDVEEFAENERESVEIHGEITEPLEEVTVSDMEGYAFTLEGLGIIRHIILSHSAEFVLYITYTAPDPESRGYEQVVERMLGSLQSL